MLQKAVRLSQLDKHQDNFFLDFSNNYCDNLLAVKSLFIKQYNGEKAFLYLSKKRFKILQFISEKLNSYHKSNIKPKDWNLSIGSWLIYTIDISYDIYSRVNIIKSKFPEIHFRTLDTTKLYPLHSSIDSAEYTQDSYNLFVLKSIICNTLSKITNLETEKIGNVKLKDEVSIKDFSFRNIYRDKTNVLSQLSHNNEAVVLANLYCTSIKPLEQIATFDPISYLFLSNSTNKIKISNYIDTNFRNDFFKNYEIEDDYDFVLTEIIQSTLPSIFLEKYNSYKSSILEKKTSAHIRSVVTAQCLYSYDPINIWMMLQRHNYKTKIIICQHGGGYGIQEPCLQENFERECSDYFATWGWRKNRTKDIPISSLQLVDLKFPYSKDSKNILFIRTERNHMNLISNSPFLPNKGLDYHNRCIDMMKSLSAFMQSRIFIKNHSNSTHTFNDIIESEFNQYNCLNPKIPIISIKSKYRLFIVDYPGTSFLQLVYLKIPFILIFSKDIFPLNDNARKFIDMLTELGVAFSDIVKASDFIEKNINIIHEWWNQREIQTALYEFSSVYCRSSPNYAEEWHEFLQSNST